MSFSFAILSLIALTKVSAHGVVQGIVVNGVYQPNYDPDITQYENPIPLRPGWSIPEDGDTGFISDFTSSDIICHINATPGGSYVTVAAGGTIELEWTVWPESHKGPMIDYLASCNGDCTTVDKTSLLFNKIDEAGLINGSPAPGTWASDTLIANNNTWSVTIPSSIAAGKYVLRHETIALHSAENVGGAQAYPQCINLEITGSGTDSLSGGTPGTSLYTATDPGILVNIYYPALTNYTIPGPALIVDASSKTQPSGPASNATSVAASMTRSSSSTSNAPTVPTYGTKPSFSEFNATTAETTSTTSTTTTTTVAASATKPSVSTSSAATVATPSASSSITPSPWEMPSAVAPSGEQSSGASWPSIPGASWPSMPAADYAASSSVQAAALSTPTLPVSFTSTFTGRIGKPTKFTCYVDES